MRRLGSINYPFEFFERIADMTADGHWTLLVKRQGRPIAGLVTFLYQERVMPYFVGATDDAKRVNAANFIYLTTMERGVEEGYRVFDFGRSRMDNPGSFNFKRLHGFEPVPLGYQRYVASGTEAPNLSPSNPRYRLARSVWSRLPLCLTKRLGARLAKHIPG
jgi:predicted N-acyltransferase